MLRASITFAVVLSFMILMLPAHGSQPLYAQQPPAGGGRGGAAGGQAAAAAVQSIDDAHRRHAEDRRLLSALLGRAHRHRCSSRSRASTPSSCTPPAWPPASARTTSASTADRRAAARVVSFQRVGPRVLLVQPNQSFRSSSANPPSGKSVEDSFAKSILWGFTVAAESDGRVLVDATDFFLRDGHGAGSALRPGTYRVDRTRSAVLPAAHEGVSRRTPRSK